MKTVNLYEARTHISRLVEEAAHGEEIWIAKNGVPLARLIPLASGADTDVIHVTDLKSDR